MNYEITKTGNFHKMTLDCEREELEEAIERMRKFKCYANSNDLEFRLHIQNLNIYPPLSTYSLYQMIKESDQTFLLRFSTYNDSSKIYVSINQ